MVSIDKKRHEASTKHIPMIKGQDSENAEHKIQNAKYDEA